MTQDPRLAPKLVEPVLTLLNDFEGAVRDHELSGSYPPRERERIIRHYVEAKRELMQLLYDLWNRQ